MVVLFPIISYLFHFLSLGCKGNDYFYKFQIIKSFSFSGVFA